MIITTCDLVGRAARLTDRATKKPARRCVSTTLIGAAFVAGAMSVLTGAETTPTRYLFLDPGLIVKAENVAVTVNPAQRRETVIRADQPWEQLMISFFLTVREEEGKLRMWYICRYKQNRPNVAYADSWDGVAWTKPDLGI